MKIDIRYNNLIIINMINLYGMNKVSFIPLV